MIYEYYFLIFTAPVGQRTIKNWFVDPDSLSLCASLPVPLPAALNDDLLLLSLFLLALSLLMFLLLSLLLLLCCNFVMSPQRRVFVMRHCLFCPCSLR